MKGSSVLFRSIRGAFTVSQSHAVRQLHKPRFRSNILQNRINFYERQPVETFLPRLLEPVQRKLSLVKSCIHDGDVKRRDILFFRELLQPFDYSFRVTSFPASACACPNAVSAAILSGDDFSAVLNSAIASSSLPSSSSRLAAEGPRAGEHFANQDASGVDVSATICFQSLCLFRCGVG